METAVINHWFGPKDDLLEPDKSKLVPCNHDVALWSGLYSLETNTQMEVASRQKSDSVSHSVMSDS